MAAQAPQKPIHSLILDTGPLIKNAVSVSTIINSAEEIFTTPAIISEIRDEATRSRVQTTLMPFVKVRNPSPASYDAVIAFSKKTGDHPVLSRQDLGILALAYEIHCERNGGNWGLREAPKQPIKKRPEEKVDVKEGDEVEASTAPVVGEQPAAAHEAGESSKQVDEGAISSTQEALEQESTEVPAQETTISEDQKLTQSAVPESTSTEQSAQTSSSEIEVTSTQEDSQPELSTAQKEVEPTAVSEDLAEDVAALDISNEQSAPQSPPETDDDDSDGEWITPSNLTARQAQDAGLGGNAKTSTQPQMDVATMTIDFAMQNVLLQMNLKLLSTNMQRIKNLTSKVLRCHACFNIVKQMDKQFCPRCGGASLKRVSCSTNAKGEFKIHLAKNYQVNKRGDKYSIPKPIAGTANTKWSGQGGGKGGWGRDLVLAEDQKEYTRHVEQEKRKAKANDLMDEDYLPGILTGDRGRAGGRMKVGAGKNVNSKRAR